MESTADAPSTVVESRYELGVPCVRQSHQDAAEPETIATFFPSNMILGPSNMILDDTDLEDSD